MPELYLELGARMDRLNQAYARLAEQLSAYGVPAEIATAHERVILCKVGEVWRLYTESSERGREPLLSAPRQRRLDLAKHMPALVREVQKAASDMLSGVDIAIELVDHATHLAYQGKKP